VAEQVLCAAQPAPLIRRFFAFCVDLIIIGAPATAVGALLFDPLSDLGDYGRLIGAAVIVLYFGYFDSRLATWSLAGAMARPGGRKLHRWTTLAATCRRACPHRYYAHSP